MSKNITRNLTEGNVFKQVLAFAFPLFLGMLFQQLYNVFDTIIVGNFLGVDALAGVGSTGAINFLVMGFCMGLGNGSVIPIAQTFGANDYSELRKYIVNTIYMALVVITALTLVSTLLCKDILVLMGTLDSVIDYAYNYILVIFIGIPITFAYNFLGGILRSVGNSKTPVIFLIIATIINIILDLLFLAVFKLSVSFAAIATIMSQLVSVMLCFITINTKYDFLKIKKEDLTFSFNKILKLLWVGIPMGLQYSITAIGSVSIQSAINSLNSTVYVAGCTAAQKMSNFLCTPFEALGSTMATFGGQNVGAKKYNRLSKGLGAAILMGFIYMAFALTTALLFGDNLALLFIDEPNMEIANAAKKMLVTNALFYFALIFVNTVRFMIQGMGYSAVAIMAGVLEMIGRVIAAFILVPKYGFIGICLASPIAWVLADMFLLPCFFILKSKMVKNSHTID